MRYLSNVLRFEHGENRIQVLVDVGTLVKRHVSMVPHDAFDRDAAEGPLHSGHLLVDPLLFVLKLPLGLSTGQDTSRPMVDAARGLVRA